MSRYYQVPISLLDTFTYPEWHGDTTITHLGDIGGLRYFHVDGGIPLPTSQKGDFQLIELTDELAARLRVVAPALALSLLVTDSARRAERNRERMAQIRDLEAQQARPLREMALGVDGARERLMEINHQIDALRAQWEA